MYVCTNFKSCNNILYSHENLSLKHESFPSHHEVGLRSKGAAMVATTTTSISSKQPQLCARLFSRLLRRVRLVGALRQRRARRPRRRRAREEGRLEAIATASRHPSARPGVARQSGAPRRRRRAAFVVVPTRQERR